MAAVQPTPDVLGELAEVRARVREQLEQLLDAIDSDGGVYADRFADWFVRSTTRRRGPLPPPSLQGKPGAMIRELVMDEAAAVRTYGRRR